MSCRAMPDCEVIFWDVGQGDASTLKLPDGSYILIDAGPIAKNGNPVSRWFAEHANSVVRKVVITHNHRDHFGGLISLLEANRSIEEVLMVPDKSVYEDPTKIDFRLLRQAIATKVNAGKLKLTWFSGAPYEIYRDESMCLVAKRPEALPVPSTASQNVTSMVLQLESPKNPDVPVIVWGGDALLQEVQSCVSPARPGVLIGPHHGEPQDRIRDKAAYKALLRTFSPGCLYVSVGTCNRYRHPQKLYLFSAAELGSTVCCSEITPRCGKYRHEGQDVYPGSMMLGIRKPFGAIECRGSMRVKVSQGGELLFDDCQVEFLEAVTGVENRYCKKSG